MKVYSWSASTDDVPAPHQGVARIWNDGGWHPVIFMAPNAEEAGQRAEDWWAEQLAKERAKQEGAARRIEAMQAAKARNRGVPINRAHAGMEPAPEVAPLVLAEDDDLVL